MKILHIIPSLDQGGAERLLVDVCDNAAAECDHVIVTLFGPVFFKPQRARIRSIDFPRRLTPATILEALRALARLRLLVAAERPDVLHGWLYYGNLLTIVLSGMAPCVVWSIHHTTFVPAQSMRLVRAARWLCRLASGLVPDRIVYCAQTARRLHEAHGYCARKSVVIFNGISFAKFAPDAQSRGAARSSLGLAVDELVIGHFARFDPQKNFRLVCEAIARAKTQLGSFRLLFAGRDTGPANAALRGMLRDTGLIDNAILLGAIDDMPRHFNAVDLVVLGSSHGEALPIILIEAAACERAIVATNVGDIGMLGLPAESVVRADDPESFAQALLREAAASRGGTSAGRRAAVAAHVRKELSIEGCTRAYEALYREVLCGHSVRATPEAGRPDARLAP